MEKTMKLAAVLSLAATFALSLWYAIAPHEALLTLAITFGTVAYHLNIRLLTGFAFRRMMNGRADLKKQWYHVGIREMSSSRMLGVKRWKGKMPTYNGELYDPKRHTWDKIAEAMCQSELIHETCAVLSFPPIMAGIWFGAFPVFITTSLLSAIFDLMFVVIQRYNRGRIMKLLNHRTK